jgi:hypothetical protein
MQTLNSFNSLALANGSEVPLSTLSVFNPEQSVPETTENIDLVSDPNVVQPVAKSAQVQDDKFIPDWGKSLGSRVTALEGDMKYVKENMATKADIAKLEQSITGLEQLIKERR